MVPNPLIRANRRHLGSDSAEHIPSVTALTAVGILVLLGSFALVFRRDFDSLGSLCLRSSGFCHYGLCARRLVVS
jgi:hypothetical protein